MESKKVPSWLLRLSIVWYEMSVQYSIYMLNRTSSDSRKARRKNENRTSRSWIKPYNSSGSPSDSSSVPSKEIKGLLL